MIAQGFCLASALGQPRGVARRESVALPRQSPIPAVDPWLKPWADILRPYGAFAFGHVLKHLQLARRLFLS
jgi:hypothetical protein